MTGQGESRVLNAAVLVLGVLLFFLFIYDFVFSTVVAAGAFGAVFVMAVNHGRPRRLFVTSDPGRWGNGVEWRQWVVVGQEPYDDEGLVVVLGRRVW